MIDEKEIGASFFVNQKLKRQWNAMLRNGGVLAFSVIPLNTVISIE